MLIKGCKYFMLVELVICMFVCAIVCCLLLFVVCCCCCRCLFWIEHFGDCVIAELFNE